MAILPLASVERLIRSAGAQRVSESASMELLNIIEEYGLKIAQEAIIYTEHADRKTVKDKDIQLAFEMIKKKSE